MGLNWEGELFNIIVEELIVLLVPIAEKEEWGFRCPMLIVI
jgi:hypothetical protein